MTRKFGAFTSAETVGLPVDQQKFSQLWDGVFSIATTLLAAFLTSKGTDAALASTQSAEIVKTVLMIVAGAITLWKSRDIVLGAIKKLSVVKPEVLGASYTMTDCCCRKEDK